MLRNGSILQGEITRQGDYYHVVMQRGELQVPVGQVDACCRNLADAYRQRRASRTGSSADSHRQLAAWCLRHDLLDYARVEVRAARAMDPEQPGLKVLENQLTQATRRGHGVREKTTRIAAPVAHELAKPAPIRELPKAVGRQFVRQIEPILLHNCASSGCHGGDSTRSLHLNRLAVEGAGHPGLTRENLASVLKQIGRAMPPGGPLLTYATSVHGSAERRSKPLGARPTNMLKRWIRSIPSASQDVQDLADSRRVAASNGQDSKLPHVSHSFGKASGLTLKETPPSTDNKHGLPRPEKYRQTEALLRGGRLTSFEPRDPFDAEIFNRRFISMKSRANPPAGKPVPAASSLQRYDRRGE